MAKFTNKQIVQSIGLVIIGCMVLGVAKLALADSYVLTASVPYGVPSVSSTINNTGTTTSTPSIVISGTCGVISPSAIVSLWNGATLLGATQCQASGTFSVVVSLGVGLNTVTPKTSNIANVYGPDGAPIVFIYTPPSLPKASTSENIDASPALQVSSPQPFGVLSSAGAVTIDITVQGGDTPYQINIKWGDGKSDSQTVAESGTYTFTHVYKQKNNYTANIKVTDKKGNSSNIVIPFSVVKGAITKRVIPESDLPLIESYKITISVLVLIVLVIISAITAFILGKQHQKRKHKIAAAKKSSKKSSR